MASLGALNEGDIKGGVIIIPRVRKCVTIGLRRHDAGPPVNRLSLITRGASPLENLVSVHQNLVC